MTPYYADDWLTVYQGDARAVLAELQAESVHCVVTSPPYFGLRDYGVAGQIGLERTVEEYVETLVAVFREVRRVMRPDATLWCNLGDTYATGTTSDRNPTARGKHGYWENPAVNKRIDGRDLGLKPKDLVGIPWRVAFALQADGWYLRSDIIWSKPNPMPESVTDRPTKSHEYLFLLSKSARYYFDADAVREQLSPDTHPSGNGFNRGGVRISHGEGSDAEWVPPARRNPTWEERKAAGATAGNIRTSPTYQRGVHGDGLPHDLGQPGTRNIRSVWTIATQPYPGAHFATFPRKLVEPCIKAGTSERGVCPECGAPWERVVERTPGDTEARQRPKRTAGMDSRTSTLSLSGNGSREWAERGPRRTDGGWRPTCGCTGDTDTSRMGPSQTTSENAVTGGSSLVPPIPVPAVVLDCFAGSGTTGMVAQSLSRRAVLIDLSMDYLGQLMERNRDVPLGLGA